MKMNEDLAMNNHNKKEEEEEEEETHEDSDEAEEALSLCDLPLAGNDALNCKEDHHPPRPSPDQEMFEFVSNDRSNSDYMSSAEDIIFGGKLLPYNYKSNTATSDKNEKNQRVLGEANQCFDFKTASSFYHHRSESVGELRRSQSSVKDRLIRSSHSLDYRKLQRGSSAKMIGANSPARRTDRSSSGNCFGKCEFSARRQPVSLSSSSSSSSPVRPRWHLFMFGLMRTPVPEMELRDIRNRLSRRSPSSMFPALDGGETVSVKRDEGKGSWKLLRAFGCKSHANAVVTASLGCIPHV